MDIRAAGMDVWQLGWMCVCLCVCENTRSLEGEKEEVTGRKRADSKVSVGTRFEDREDAMEDGTQKAEYLEDGVCDQVWLDFRVVLTKIKTVSRLERVLLNEP